MDNKLKKSTGLIILNEKKELLLLKRIKTGIWTFPGGKTEEGESSHNCAVRELKEETGLENVELKFYSYTTSLTNGIQWKEETYIGHINKEIQVTNIETDIFSEIKFCDLNNLPDFSEIEAYDHELIKMLKGERKTNTSFEGLI